MKLKELTKEEFMKQDGATEELYEAVQNAKSGFITICKISNHFEEVHSGHTDFFTEGLSLRIVSTSRWFTTSIIKKINWEDNTFETLNSIYKFKFREIKNET